MRSTLVISVYHESRGDRFSPSPTTFDYISIVHIPPEKSDHYAIFLVNFRNYWKRIYKYYNV